MKQYTLTLLLLVAVLASACRKDAPEQMNLSDKQLCNTPSQVFDAFWHGMNTGYVFWDIDPTDWDRVYDEYMPRFRELNRLETVDNELLLDLYTEACKDLIDHHLYIEIINVNAPDSTDNKISLQPGINEIMSRGYYHMPILGEVLFECKEADKQSGRIQEYMDGTYYKEDDEDCMWAISYRIDHVIYLYFSNFNFSGVLGKDPEGDVAKTLRNFQRMILETPDIEGVIIDVRDNLGGYLSDIQEVFALMLDSDLTIGHTRSKEGLGRLDYGPWVPCTIAPAQKHRKVEAPIVILTNVWSGSMAETTAMAVSALPNGCVVGERTFGATGPLADSYLFTYGGANSNACVKITTSTSMTKYLRGGIIEGMGVTPDIEVIQDEKAMRSGIDGQLERALEYIRTGK